MTATMTPEIAAALREPFKPEQVGKLPRITCSNCSQNPGRCCSNHSKSRCDECSNWITSAHLHLDYVGHAAATDRLLAVDPLWTWEPVSFDDRGLPAFDAHGGLWIRLTVAGVTRLGYGDADGRNGQGTAKIAIGDAIRNAAMRFGVALDLWAKEDLHADRERADESPESEAPEPQYPAAKAKRDLLAIFTTAGLDTDAAKAAAHDVWAAGPCPDAPAGYDVPDADWAALEAAARQQIETAS